MAKDWSELWTRMHGLGLNKETYMWKFYEILLGNYNLKGKKVLEIGCGTGMNSIVMASMGAKVTFLDKTKEALNLVKNNLDGASMNCELVQGDVFDYKFGREFDLVHSEGVIEHVDT